MNNLVSIILPAYNVGKYIDKTIESVIGQTHTNWELLVINDGSLDDTQVMVNKFSDPRIRYFEQQNMGVGAARNLALRHMKGAYFCFLDGDDQLPPNSLESRMQFMEAQKRVNVLNSAVEVRDASMQRVLWCYHPHYAGIWWKDLVTLSGKSFFGPNVFLRNSSVLLPFREGMTHGEDLLFYLDNAYRHQWIIESLDQVCYWYRSNPTSAMSNIDGLASGYRILLKRFAAIPENSWLQKATVWFKIRKILLLCYIRRGNYRKALSQLVP